MTDKMILYSPVAVKGLSYIDQFMNIKLLMMRVCICSSIEGYTVELDKTKYIILCKIL